MSTLLSGSGGGERTRTLDPDSAVELVRRIGAGEAGAEGELVERAGPALRFLCRRFTRSDADAEDLYQETLMLALEKIRGGEVREPERLAGFLRALARNVSTQEYRRHRYAAESSVEALPEAPDHRRADPLSSAMTSERSRAARNLLQEMAVPRDREILLRYYLAEEPSSRICADLALDPDHFYRVLHRARKRFHRLWQERHPPAKPPSAGARASP